MAIEEKAGRNFARKIALPAIFVISIIAARLIINFRSAITLSAPVELSRCGLWVSMPSGNGWQSDNRWVFEKNSFLLRSILSLDQTTQSYAQCQYLLATEPVTPKERFDKQAADFEGRVDQTGQIESEGLVVDWARIIRNVSNAPGESNESGPFDGAAYEMLFGVCPLAAGRYLEIEVVTQEEEKGLTWEAFEKIVKDIRFSDNGLLQAGEEIIDEVTGVGISAFLPDSNRTANPLISFFIVSSSRGRPIGFTLDVLADDNEARPSVGIKAAHYFYMRVPIPNDEIGFCRADSDLEQFTWKVESRSRIGGRGIEMTGKNGILTISFEPGRSAGQNRGRVSSKPQSPSEVLSSSGSEQQAEYALGQAAVPDIVLEPVLKKLLASGRQEIILDVILSNGTIAPVYIEKKTVTANQPSSQTSSQPIVAALRLEVLDGRGFWQQNFYDDEGQPVKTTLGRENTLVLQRATEEQVAQAFPERADVVRSRNKLLEGNDQ